jgi:flavin reductase (DIM6/NTAB) family NADH-FMN oxidoreductase RutF
VLEDLETIGVALGRIPSGCSILTAVHDGRSTGLLVSWVQQATFDPPAITVCLKQGRPASQLINASGRFLLNVIGEDSKTLFHHFGKGFALEEDAFNGLSVRETAFGPLIESCIAHLGCKVAKTVPVGDHDLYVGEVVAAGVVEGAKPYTHLRKNGLAY